MKKFSEVYKSEKQKVLNDRKARNINDYKAIKNALMEAYHTTDPNSLPNKKKKAFITSLNECYKKDKGLTAKGRKFLETHVLTLNENSTEEQKRYYLRKKINESVSLNLEGSGIKESITSIIDEMYKDIKASNISQVLSPSLIANIIRDTLITQVDRYMIPIYSELSDIPLDDDVDSNMVDDVINNDERFSEEDQESKDMVDDETDIEDNEEESEDINVEEETDDLI